MALQEEPGRDDVLAAARSLAQKPQVAASALDLLEEHYRGAGNLEEVVRLYDRRVELASTDADRVALLTEAAAVWENDIGRPEQALAVLRRAVRIDPRDRHLIDSLERLAERTGRWADLDGLVDDIAAHGDLDRRELYELRLRSASWYRDRLGDMARAERALAEAIQLDPEPIEAHAERVALIRSQGRVADLVSALRAWSESEPSTDTRVALLREAADLARSKLSDLALSADCYEALLGFERNDVPALQALCEIRGEQSRWNEVVGLLEQKLQAVAPEERASVARAIGQVYRDHLDDPRAAIRAYEAALDLDEDDALTTDALEALYRENDRLEALRALLERRTAKTSDEDRAALQLRLAQLYEHSFRDQAGAIAMFRQVLKTDPDNEIANADLERLFEATSAWHDLVALLSSRAGRESDQARRALLERIARVHESKLGDVDAAIAIYGRIDSELGADEHSLRAMARLCERTEKWPEVADALERLAAQLEGQDALDLLHRAAGIWEERVRDVDQAGRVLRGAYERFPHDAATRERIKEHYASRGDHRALAQVLDAELESAASDEERVALLRTLSNVYRDRLEDPKMAASYLERAVELDSSDRGALVPLCDLYVAAGRQKDAVPILQRIIQSFGRQRTKELALYYHRLGQALEAMGDVPGALEAYDAAFKIDLTNVAILRDLGKLTHANGDLDRAQKSFRALLLQKLEPDAGIRKADVYYYLGDIAVKQDDRHKAITMLERALAEDVGHEQASQLLTQLKG
jgi:tetratricopeptide (TPR) repeat protein